MTESNKTSLEEIILQKLDASNDKLVSCIECIVILTKHISYLEQSKKD